ncbi:hypothetical protein H7J86_26095 [Mycobacterium hackensackense]|uniref:3'-5' exonuclease n=1 Tax=Mycobacterium hackensackense TaxID=228909 RepID=UPI002265F43E|nr:hypothetical protein [Mycobacterium hackensackense]MCV7255640.1 hypothetical protein [Mycobacterium hackensackense]
MTTVFLDTETLGTSRRAPIWEFAAVRIDDNGEQVASEHFQIVHNPALVDPDLPQSFRDDYARRYNPDEAVPPELAASAIAEIVRGDAVIAGSNPAFDMEKLTDLLGCYGLTPGWNYHPFDVPGNAVGWLAAQGKLIRRPWKSDAVSRAVGINPDDFDRHTAMGDVEWCWDLYIAITGGEHW